MQSNEAINHDMLSFSTGAESPTHSPNSVDARLFQISGFWADYGQTGSNPCARKSVFGKFEFDRLKFPKSEMRRSFGDATDYAHETSSQNHAEVPRSG
jgi:hypothetical protein